MNNYKLKKGLKFGAMFLAFALVAGLVVMLLWNALMPAIFGLTTITLLQGIGLLILSKILFGGFPGQRGRYKKNGRHGHWREKMKARWDNMNEEEREAFKAKFPWKNRGPWKDIDNSSKSA